MAGINIATITADLQLNSGNLQQGLAGARVALTAIEKEFDVLADDLAKGRIGLNDYNARCAALNATFATLTAQMKAANSAVAITNGGLNTATATATATGAAMGAASGGAQRFGYALMQVGAFADDAQYGFRAVINNLGGLTQALVGAGAAAIPALAPLGPHAMAIAAGVQVAGVAIYQLYMHWNELMTAMGLGAPKIASVAEEMKNLADKTDKTANELDRLNQLKRQTGTKESLEGKQTSAESEAKSATEAAIAEVGGEGKSGFRRVWEAMLPKIRKGLTAEEREEAEGNERYIATTPGGDDGMYGPQIKKARERNKELRAKAELRDQERAKDFVSRAADEDIIRNDIINEARAHPEKFGGKEKADDLIRGLKASSAKSIKADRENDEESKYLDEKDAANDAEFKKQRARRLAFEAHDREMEKQSQQVNIDIEKDASKEMSRKHGASEKTPNEIREKLMRGRQAGVDAYIDADVYNTLQVQGKSENYIRTHLRGIVDNIKKSVEDEITERAASEGITRQEAATRIAEEETTERFRVRDEAYDTLRGKQTALRHSEYALEDLIKEHNKPQFSGYEEYAKKLALGGFDTENYQRKIFEASEAIQANTKSVADQLTKIDKLGNVVP